jgi:acyl-CoA thioesterase II
VHENHVGQLWPESVGPLRSTRVPPAGRNGFDGGGLLAHLVVAAAATARPAGRPHSLKAHFLRAGVSSSPVDYVGDILRSSHRFTTTRINAVQSGTLLASATVFVSFR